MKHRFSRVLAGLLAMILVVSSGSGTVFAKANQKYAAAGVISTEESGKTGAPEGDAQNPEKDTTEGKEQTPDTTPEQPSGDTTPPAGQPEGNGSGENEGQNPDESGQDQENQDKDKLPKDNGNPDDTTQDPDQTEPLKSVPGSIEVQIVAGIEVQKEQNFELTLAGSDKHSTSMVLPASKGEGNQAEEAPEAFARFSNLKNGKYTLTITGKGYVPYTQEIEVGNMGCRIQVYTGSIPQMNQDKQHPGVLRYGDVNQDGELNKKDEEAILNAIESDPNNTGCDLNGDGIVDLLDLNYFTTLKEAEKKLSSLELLIPEEAMTLEAAVSTRVEGDLNNLLSGGTGNVGLAPAAGGSISADTPVAVQFDFSGSQDVALGGLVIQSPKDSEYAIQQGEVQIHYLDASGADKYEYVSFSAPSNLRMLSAPAYGENSGFKASWDANGALCIDLGGQIAVKHVILKITKTAKSQSLAEISRVEFVNDMETRIPEPTADIPVGLKAEPANKSFTISWNKASNVTGYEISITSGGKTEFRKTTSTNLTISQFNKDKLKNGTEYLVSVRSTNGEWKSAYCDEVPVVPKASGKPPAPDGVSVKGGYRSVDVRWKKTEDADSYNVYWKEDGEAQFQKIAGIEGLYYQINDLKDSTKYTVYVTAANELGEGPKSLEASGKTISGLIDAKLPAYRLINTSNGSGVLSNHIKAASIGGGGVMVDSVLDTEKNSALGLLDNNYASYVQRDDWDYGGAYPGGDKGMTVELDGVYDLGMIAFAEPLDLGAYMYVTVQYWDESGTKQTVKNITMLKKRAANRDYYLIKFKDPVRTSKIQFGIGRYNGGLRKTTVSEIRFYEYDSIEQDIMNLYGDDLHITLREDVTKETIDQLQGRLDTTDPVSGEYHPERTALQKELDTARKLLETGGLNGVLHVNPEISRSKDAGISVGGMNGWQPLGVTAAAGDELVVYVGHPGKKEGAATTLSLVYTQQHAESSALSGSVNLKIGRNEIKVGDICSTDKERGGALYIQYSGSSSDDAYAVRVSGGTSYPVLRLYGVSEEEKNQRIQTYVQELSAYVSDLSKKHQELHDSSENENVHYAYNERECILNLTDIQTDQMMLSIPASQVLAGLGTNPEERLSKTVQAMGDMLTLFYQHKGLTNSFAEGTNSSIIDKNHLPYQYLNIRYMKMFAGAFMYAAGNHIGIEWNETSGMMGGDPVVSDESGRYQSGRYYGWGIAHEIGHNINQGAYAHAEVTNNYFAVLAQAKDDNNTVRFKYPEVFKKVTSGTEGAAGNVFTQLGMYWQLHLAYDRDYNFKTYGNYDEIFSNLFFARVDSYARDTSRAPKPGGVALTLNGGREQNLMRLASAAAERDLSDFFIRWGMRPDSESTAYMKQFEPEKRAIYYVDDTARVYEMEHTGGDTFTGKQVVTANASANNSQVTLTMTYTGSSSELLQGYEITRVFIEGGQERRETAGFTQTNTFTDQAAFAANHVIRYEVTAIDKYLNRSNVCQAGTVKIEGDGLQDKSAWTASTNMTSKEDTKPNGTEDLPCESETVSAVTKVIDGSAGTAFTGTAEAEDPYILLELNQSTPVSALEYTFASGGQAVTDYKIEISEDGQVYREVGTGTFAQSGGKARVYFTNGKDNWICTYDAAYVKLTAVGQQERNISVAELDLYGPSGDNVEFMSASDGQKAIGKLASDYQYGKKADEKIPKGSIVFTGNYKGNPAYNVVVLYDENGNIVGGTDAEGALTAHQIILADDPKDALLGETSDGTWIYWIEPSAGISAAELPGKVRAELYRVDNALTNEGQRLVSDTEFTAVPQTLPDINLGSSKN